MHTLSILLGWALCGLIIGFIARLLVPGRHPLGFIRTMLLGVLGALLGGLVSWAIYRPPGEPFSFTQDSWPGWILSIIGAVVLLLLYAWWQNRQPWWRRWW